jgi:hypothetical protein
MSKRTHTQALPALALLLLLSVLTRGASAQGWKSCGTDWYEVMVPVDWSCQHDPGGDRLVATGHGEGIRFALRSSPVRGELPSDPALLKKYLTEQLDLLNSPANVRYAVTTRDVAVETINGLRGAVAELSWAEPMRGEDGTPTLARFAGFALLAEGGGRRYDALILCPLARFTYNSALMNRVLNDIRVGGLPTEVVPPREGSGLDGVWELSEPEGNYRMTLRVSGDSGTLKVEWRDARGEFFIIEQQAALEPRPYGTLIVGSRPAYVTDNATRPAYAADTLLLQRQTNDSWKVWTRDDVNVKQWTPLHLRRKTP